MKETIGLSQFRDAFNKMRPDNFSYEGLELLFDYLEDCDPEMELDVIGLCCDYSELTPQEIADSYDIDIEEDGNEMLNVMDYLADYTSVIGYTETTVIFQNF